MDVWKEFEAEGSLRVWNLSGLAAEGKVGDVRSHERRRVEFLGSETSGARCDRHAELSLLLNETAISFTNRFW